MSAVERRNSVEESDYVPEYLVRGKFGVNEEDVGKWDTLWCSLGWLLDQTEVEHDEVEEAVTNFLAAEEAARNSLFSLAAPAPASA